MVLVSNLKKFIYIKNKKVAGTSVEAYFEKHCLNPSINHIIKHESDSHIGIYGIIGNREGGKKGKFFNHMSANKIKKNIGNNIFNNYLKFCVIRNPYDKMVSLFNMKKNRDKLKMSFLNFVKSYDCINYTRYFINGKSCIDFYIRFEHLHNDLEKLCNKLNIKYDINLLPKYKSEFRKDNDYKKYYNDETKKIVYNKHKKEFIMFDYKF